MSLLLGLAARALGEARPVRAQPRANRLPALQPDLAAAGEPAAVRDRMPRLPMPIDAPARAGSFPSRVADNQVSSPPPPWAAHDHPAETRPAPAHRDAHDPSPRARADAPLPDPEPLVRYVSPPSDAGSQPRVGQVDARRRERPAVPAAMAPAPTEVHVSIGRVELTALPSSPPPRASRPRADNANALGDYLRAPRGSA